MTSDPSPPQDAETAGAATRLGEAPTLPEGDSPPPTLAPVSSPAAPPASWFSLPTWPRWGGSATPPPPATEAMASGELAMAEGAIAPAQEPLAAEAAGGSATTLDWLNSWWRTAAPAETLMPAEALTPVEGTLAAPAELSSDAPAVAASASERDAGEARPAGFAPLSLLQSQVTAALVGGIRLISSERDRDEIIRWFIGAREILAKSESSGAAATTLYSRIDTLRLAQLLTNTVATSFTNYTTSSLPLALKVALPVTAAGMTYFGAQGAGLVAFGSAVGLPVTLLLFLGTAGVTSVVEAFVKDRGVRDPLTRLMLTFVAFETARRARKEFLDALRADAMTPLRAETPAEEAALLASLLQMDPVAFERHVMSFFEQDGHPTGLTARSNDYGVDGYVLHPDGLVIVQCKRYALDNPVGRPAVQQFKGVVEEQRAYRGYYVTTSRFTDGAAESAGKNDRLILIDGDELLRWHVSGRPAFRL